ncbi:msx2-interacting protein-like [Saccostrea echinata]|uniref:msx2-interacting protein-like n=1 Tax=Saccostrea echinata TaxID=191078 RepID=UPI002A7FAD6B|nr:msx2-interacting protein-like [Saccostrea echinata]
MVRETRYLLVGNLPEKTTEDAVAEHFKRYGKIQSVKLHHRENEEGSSAIVAFGDIKSASKAHGAENKIDGNVLSTEYSEGSATGSAVTRTVEQRPGYSRPYSRSKGSEEGESFDSYYGSSRYSGSYGEEIYNRGRPRERFSGRGTFKSYDTRGGFHGRVKSVDQSSQDGFEKPKVPQSPAHSTSHSGSRHSSKYKKKKQVSRSGSQSSSSSSSSNSTSSSASRSSSRSSSRCSASRANALPAVVKTSYRTESQESNNSDKTGANDDDKRPRGIIIHHLPMRSTDTSLRDGLFHEYKKYGKVNAVLVAGVGDDRYAVVSFRKPEDAIKALSASQDKVFFGSKIKVAQHEGIEVDDNEFRPPEAELDEHHPKATRTLFVGNLEKDISNQELRERFLKYGDILDIDVKRQGAVSAYAFVQFTDIRSVVKVLREMEGEVWGSMKLKLGFGKSMPTNCVWLDNVDQTVQENFLSRQFGRYGQVTHGIIDRIKGKALVYFTNAEQAQYALVEMRNRILNNKKIMIDFASRDCQAEFYEQMEKNGQLKAGLRPDERRGWMYNRQTAEGQWEASYDNRPANFFKFSPGFRGRGSRTAGRGGSRGYKEEFSDEYRRTRSYEDYRYPGDSDDFEQDLRAYQRERQHGSQSPPPYIEEVYEDPAYRRSKDYYKYAESYRSGSPHSDRAFEGYDYDKIRLEEKYYGKERYVVRERSPDVEYSRRSWSRSPSHGAPGQIKENVGRNTPPTPMDDEARDFSSRDVSPMEEGQTKFGDSKNKRRSEDDFNINEADIAELTGRPKYPGMYRTDSSPWTEDKFERKRSYDETFGQDYIKSPRKLDRQLSNKSALERIEFSKRDLYQKYQIIQSRITEKLKGRNESSPSSASSGSEPGQLNEGELSKLQHEKALLLEKLKQLDKESSTSDIEEAFDSEDPRKVLSKRARMDPVGPWGDSVHHLQMESGTSVPNIKSYDYKGLDSTSSVRKQPDNLHEKERNKSCTRSSVEGSDHEEFTSVVSPKDVQIGFRKKRRKGEHSDERSLSFRSKHSEEEDHVSSDNDEVKNISRFDQLSSNPVFRRLSSNHSSPRTPHFSHESSNALHKQHKETDVSGSEGIPSSHSEEMKHHKKTESFNKSHSHRSKHRHKEDHQPPIIPLGDDFPNPELLDPRNPDRIHKSLSLPLPKFAELDANVMTSPDVNISPDISKSESPRFSSPSSGSKNTSSPQRSPSESASTNSQENPPQEYIPEENPSDMNNDGAPVEPMEGKGEFDSDGSSDHSDHNDNFEMDKISLEERIRRLDEKLNAVPLPQSSTKLASEMSSLSSNSTVVSKSDTQVSSLSRTALYSKFKINKKEVTPGTGTDVKTGESTDIAKKVTSRFSIIDQDTKRLQDKIYENYSPKPTSNLEDTQITMSPMTPLRTKGAVKEMPAQMPNLSTLPGSLAGRLGNGAAPFPTLTVTTTTSNNGKPEEINAVDVSTVNSALAPAIPEKQWPVEGCLSSKSLLKPWQIESASVPKNSSNDQSNVKDFALGQYLSEESAQRPLITPAFKKQMSDNFSRTDEKSSPKISPKFLNKSPSPSMEKKAGSPTVEVSLSPKSDNKLSPDISEQRSNLPSESVQCGSEMPKMETEKNSVCNEEVKTNSDFTHDSSSGISPPKSEEESMDVSAENSSELREDEGKRNNERDDDTKPKSTPPVVLTKAEVKDMSPLKLTKQSSGSKEKSSNSSKESQKKQNQESFEELLGLNSPVVFGKRKAETEEVNKSQNERDKKDVVREQKSECNGSDSDSKEVEKLPQSKKPKISETESQSSDTSPEKMDKSNSSAKSKDSQKKEKSKDSKKKEKCEGDSVKKDKNNHERKDKDKDGGRDKGTNSSSTKSQSLSSSSSSKPENNKNGKTDEKIIKSSKTEQKKPEKSSKVTGSTKSLDDKSKGSETSSKSDDKNSKLNKEKNKVSSSEHKKDTEKEKKASDHSVHRKDSKSNTTKSSSESKSKEKSKNSKEKVSVKSKDTSKTDKNTKEGTNDKNGTKEGTNDKNGSKVKKEEKHADKNVKPSGEKSNTEKAKEVSEGKEKNAVPNEKQAKPSKATDSENKGKNSSNLESTERNKEKSPSTNTGNDTVAPTDQLKDKVKGKHEKSGKSKHKDETKSKSKEKHLVSEKTKDKVSKDGKSSHKKEENRTESRKDSSEKKTEAKTEQTESSKSNSSGSNEKNDDKKSENTDGKMETKNHQADSNKKKLHESDKIHKVHRDKPKSSSSSVSEDILKGEQNKYLKEAEKSKPSKPYNKSKQDVEKTIKTEGKLSKSEGEKKKSPKVIAEKKKSNKENKSDKSGTSKKKDKKEETEEHTSSEAAKKADDDFDWDAWQEPYVSMYDKVKRRSTIKDKEREMEQNRQKQLDKLQERRQKKSKSNSILQSDISSTNYTDSDERESTKKPFNKRRSKSKKIYSSSDSDSDFTSSIFPSEKKLQPQKPTMDPSKKSKKTPFLDIYSSDSDESTDSSFSALPVTKKKVKPVKRDTSIDSDDMFPLKSKNSNKKDQQKSKPKTSYKSTSGKKQSICSIYSSSDESDDSDSDLDFGKKFSRAKGNNFRAEEKKPLQKSNKIYSSSDSESAEEPDIIPAPKPISLPSKSPKDKKKGKQKILDDELKKHVNETKLADRKTSSDRETSKSSVVSQTVHEKDIRADSLLDSMEKVTERNKKEKLAKKNKKKEKENILVGEGKLEIGKNSQFGLFEKMETFMIQSDAKDRSSSKDQKAATEEAFKNKVKDLQSPPAQDQVKKQKDNKKKKTESKKDREVINKKQPALISPIMSPVNEFSSGININDCKTDVGNVIVDEIPLDENSVLMDHPCSMENDNARSMWDSSDETFAEHQRNESLEKEKMSSLSSATDDLQILPEKTSSDAEDSKTKKMKKKKVVKDGEVPKKNKKMDKLVKDGSKQKKKKNKNKTCSEVDKTIDDVSKGKDILQSHIAGTEEPENQKIENTHTDLSDVDLDFSTPLFGNFVPEKIKPNRPSAKEKVGDEDTIENEVSGEGERVNEPTESEMDSKACLQEPSLIESTAEKTANLKDVENKTSVKKDSSLVLSPALHVALSPDIVSPLQDVDKGLGKELNSAKPADNLWKEVKGSSALNVSTSKVPESSPSQKKKFSKNESSGRSDIFDFNDDEEEVFDKLKPRHNAERDNGLKSKTTDSNKTPFKWDIGDITSKDTKTSFEPKLTNKLVNHKQESLFASWAKSLAESHEKDQNINKLAESNFINKLPKKHTSIKKQPKAQQKHERADTNKDSISQEVADVASRDNVSCDTHATEKSVICKNSEVDKSEKEEKEDVAKKLEEENSKIAETLEAVSTIEQLQNEEKRERENDIFADEGSLVIDETNACLPENIEQPADQEPPQADSETALAIQSILGLGEEDTGSKLHDYSEPEPVVETPLSSHQTEEIPVAQDLLEETPRDENQLRSSLVQEPMQDQVILPPTDFTLKTLEHVPAPKPLEQVAPTSVSLTPQKTLQTMAGLHDLKPKTPRGKKQADIKEAQQRSYQQLVIEDPLQDTQNKDDSDDGALHIATDLPPLPHKEEQSRKMHQPLENVEQIQNTPQEFEIPTPKKTKTRRKKSGKGTDEPNSIPVSDLKPNSVFEPSYGLPVSIRSEPETEVNTVQDVSGFASPPFAGDKVMDDKEISMSDYTDSERNDDGDLGCEEPKRPQRGASRRKNYKKMSGISPRNNSPRSRTSPRSPRIASPKQLSPKSDIATPVVKIERLPMTNKNLKLDEEQASKDIQLSITPVKETVPGKDSGVRRGRSAGSAIETPQKTLNVYDFDEVESEEQNAPIPKRRSSSRKKKCNEEAFDTKDSGKVLKSEIMDTGIKMTIRPTVRPSKDISKEKGTDLQRLNETRMAPSHENIPKDPVPSHPIDEKRAMKPREIMSAEHRARAHSFANEIVKPSADTEHFLAVAPQPTTSSPMSNIDRIIDNVSKGIFDAADGGEIISPQQLNKFTTPLTVDIGAYERKRTASRGSFTEEFSLKSPSVKSPSLRSPQISGTSPAFQLPTGLVKTPPSSISAVNPLYQSKINAIIPNSLYPGHMAELQNREPVGHHLMPSTPTATSSPISTQSSVIGTMANKLDIHVTMTMPHLANNAGRVPAHMSGSLGKPVTTQKEIGMNLTKSAFESAPTSVLSTVSSSSIGRSVIASAHSQLAQNSTVAGIRTQRTQPNSAAVESGQRIQHISPHLPNQNAHSEEKPGIVASVSIGERQQQSVTSAPTCVVHPITTTSLSKQPHNMPTMIQPPAAGERFFSDPKLREGLTKEQLQRLPYHQIMQEMQQHQAQKPNKTCQKQLEIGKESPQRPPSAHSNQHKQMLPGEAHARIAQEQAAYLAMQDQLRTQMLHKQGFFTQGLWPHPHLASASVKSDDKKQEVKTTSPNMHQQSNIIAASSQHPQIKSPALAQTAPSIHQMGHQPVTNTSLANISKKTADKTNAAAMRWGNEMVISAHEGPKSRPPSHETPRASPREHWTQPSNIPSQMGLKPAHQPLEHNAPMSQKEHIKKKRAEERKQQELEEIHYQRQRELQFIEKQIQMEQANALHKPSSSTSNQPTDMRQTAHVPGQQRPDGQVDSKNLIDPRFVQHPLYPGMPDMRRPSSQNPSAFTPPISGSDISPAIPAHKNYAEIQQQLYQQHPHLYNVALDPQFHLLTSGLPSHYLPRPGGLSIQDLTDPAQSGRSRSPPRVQNVPVSSQTSSKHREQEERMVPMHETPMHMQPRVIQEAPAPGGEGSLLSLLQRYPVMWQGVLALKNDQCVVQLHMINGYEQLVKLSLPPQGPDGSVQPLRIAQRMRLEAAQLDGVIKRMKFDNDYCMLLALPCGRDHDHIIEQTRAMTTGFIQYLQQKQAAGIVNVAEPETQQPAYVVHIFPPCDFSRNTLERLGFDLMQPLRDLAHLLVIITTVA